MTLPRLRNSRWRCPVRSPASPKPVSRPRPITTGELAAGGHPPDDPGCLQAGQVPAGRGARHAGKALGDVADAHRVPRADEQADGLPPGSLPLARLAQPP